MSSIKEIEENIIDEFSTFYNWNDKYEYLIELGKSLSPMEDNLKTDDRKVSGCQSQVWLNSHFENGKIYFQADSDAIITKGIVSLLIRVLSGQKPEDIINADLSFIDKIGLREHLSMTRANGLISMIKHIKDNAKKYLDINN